MNVKNIILVSLLTSLSAHAMHVQDLSTPIKFSEKEKSLFLWLRDNRNHDFGNIPVYNQESHNPPFKQIGTIKTLDTKALEKFALGRSIYCHDVFQSGFNDRGGVFICTDYSKSQIDPEFVKRIENDFKLFYLLQLYTEDRVKK